MGLTILSVAYPLTEVSADAVGGSEQILTILDRVLTSAGHRSLVIAAEGSKIAGTLIPSLRTKERLDDAVRDRGRKVHRHLIEDTLANYAVDLIHMHSLDFHCYLPLTDKPVLATLHLPPDWYPQDIFNTNRGRLRLNCVSWSQHRRCPPCAHLLPPTPNGVDVHRLAGDRSRRNFVLAMGRICPEKGFHLALEAARTADAELLLAGEVFPYESHLEYFSKQILPRLDDRRRFIGRLQFPAKRRLLLEAKCLLIPSTVEETSSLVAMEALACGTPVIAFRTGALPEIIQDGQTGFLVSDVNEMVDALRNVDQLDPAICRETAHSRYSSDVMGARYLRLYHRLIEEYGNDQVCVSKSWATQWAANP